MERSGYSSTLENEEMNYLLGLIRSDAEYSIDPYSLELCNALSEKRLDDAVEMAAAEGELELMETLIESGVDVERALVGGVKGGREDAVRMAIGKGACEYNDALIHVGENVRMMEILCDKLYE